MPFALIAILVVLFAGGGVTAAANQAKPGDALYGYKLAINEPVETALAGSDAVKAALEAALANRRLAEAESTAAAGTLTPALQQEIQANFQARVAAVQQLVHALQFQKNFQAASTIAADLGTSLSAHAQILAQLSAKADKPQEKTSLEDLQSAVKQESERADAQDASVQEDASKQAPPDVQAAALGRQKSAQNKIDEVQKYLDTVKDRIGADAYAKASAQLDVAKASMKDGQAKLDAKDDAGAFSLFSAASRQAQSAQEMAQAKDELNVEIDLEEQGESGAEAQQETTEGTKEQEQKQQQKQEMEKQQEQEKQPQEAAPEKSGASADVNVRANVQLGE